MAYSPPTTTCESCGTRLLLCQHPDCGKPIPRNQHESVAAWGKREYCSVSCANAIRQIRIHGEFSPAVKPCGYEGCDREAVQRQNETPTSFLARKYCRRECAQAARRNGPLSNREQRIVRREARAARKNVRSTKHLDVATSNKPLIRDIPVVKPKVEQAVWRPAAWRALEERA